MNVVQQGPGSIRRVSSVDFAGSEAPQQVAVDRAEGEIAALRAFGDIRCAIQQPGELGDREVRVEQESGLGRENSFVSVRLQPCTKIGGAPVLSDDSAM